MPPVAAKGALFDRGANFSLVGKQTGELAAQVLKGADMAKIPIRNFVPDKLIVNPNAVEGLKDPWRVPDDVLRKADQVIKESHGSH